MWEPTPSGKGKRAMRVNQLQEQIGRGEYRVDTLAVAEAIVRKLLDAHRLTPGGQQGLQGECS
jgi:anti-sigma28 factor (negative regulator of flagellin synthesis)